MKQIQPKHPRILAIAPSTRGFGYAVLEGQETLADWGTKAPKGNKNNESLARVKELITDCLPDVIILQDTSAEGSRRCHRIRVLSKRIITLAASLNVRVVLYSRDKVMRTFFANGEGTKHALAEIIAKKFPEELGFQLPPKRQAWMNEDFRMDIFEAVALVLMPRLQKKKRTAQ